MRSHSEISLTSDIFFDDITSIVHWLQNKRITKFLNEKTTAADDLVGLKKSTAEPLLRLRLSKDGDFFLIRSGDAPLGFIKTVSFGNSRELVVLIGEEENWGKGYGRAAVAQCLNILFLQKRVDIVRAKIHFENSRSLGLFENLAFNKIGRAGDYHVLQISQSQYIAALLNGNSVNRREGKI